MAITKIKTENHDEWLSLRKQYVGGSDAATVLGLNPFSSPYTLWAEKTGRKEGFKGNLATEMGTYLEDFVAQKWAAETGEKVHRENMSILNSDYPWAIANIDRKVAGKDEGLECKTCSDLRTREFKNGEYPVNYYVQCQHYMMMTGYKMWHLAVLIGNHDFKIFDIPRDDEEIEALAAAEKAFWDLVKSNTPPEVDGSDSTADTLKTIWKENGSTGELFGMDQLLDVRKNAMNQIKELTELKTECENKIRVAMGEMSKATCGSYNVSYKYEPKINFDWKKMEKDFSFQDFGKYKKDNGSRVLRITEKKT